jgi:hypothetical protein
MPPIATAVNFGLMPIRSLPPGVHHFETMIAAISKLRVHHGTQFGPRQLAKTCDKSAAKLVNGRALAFV